MRNGLAGEAAAVPVCKLQGFTGYGTFRGTAVSAPYGSSICEDCACATYERYSGRSRAVLTVKANAPEDLSPLTTPKKRPQREPIDTTRDDVAIAASTNADEFMGALKARS